MPALPVLTVADPRELAVLKSVAQPVERVDDEVRSLLEDMRDTMYVAIGVGIAANQVGVLKRLVVIDLKVGEESEPDPVYFVNPEIVWASAEMAACEEGCLSIPGVYDEVVRPARVRVKYLDFDGQPQELEAEGLMAVCIQHEIEHLDGVLFIDHLSRLKRDRAVNRVKRERRTARDAA